MYSNCELCSSYGYRIWLPEYFKHLLRNTANDTHEGCYVGTDDCSQLNTSCSSVYLDTLAVSGTSIPGFLVGIVTINLVGARVQYGTLLYAVCEKVHSYMCVRACVCVQAHVCVCVCVQARVCVCVCVYRHVCVCVCVCVGVLSNSQHYAF